MGKDRVSRSSWVKPKKRGLCMSLDFMDLVGFLFLPGKKKNEHTLTPVLRVKFEKETCLKGRRAGFL